MAVRNIGAGQGDNQLMPVLMMIMEMRKQERDAKNKEALEMRKLGLEEKQMADATALKRLEGIKAEFGPESEEYLRARAAYYGFEYKSKADAKNKKDTPQGDISKAYDERGIVGATKELLAKGGRGWAEFVGGKGIWGRMSEQLGMVPESPNALNPDAGGNVLPSTGGDRIASIAAAQGAGGQAMFDPNVGKFGAYNGVPLGSLEGAEKLKLLLGLESAKQSLEPSDKDLSQENTLDEEELALQGLKPLRDKMTPEVIDALRKAKSIDIERELQWAKDRGLY